MNFKYLGFATVLWIVLISITDAQITDAHIKRDPCRDVFARFTGSQGPLYHIVSDKTKKALLNGKPSEPFSASDLFVVTPEELGSLESLQVLFGIQNSMVYVSDKDVSSVNEEMMHKIHARETSVFLSLPESVKQCALMFKLDEKGQEVNLVYKSIRNAVAVLPTVGNVTFLGRLKTETGYAEELRKRLKEEHGKVISIVGHNSSGELVLPDGEGFSLEEIRRLSNENNNVPLIISCNTLESRIHGEKGFFSTRVLPFVCILEGISSAEATLGRRGCMYFGDYVYFIEKALQVENCTCIPVKFVLWGGVGAAVGFTTYLIVDDRRNGL